MSNFDENVVTKLKRLEREIERLKVGSEKAAPDGWIPVSSTWTYASATTITVPSGAAAIYNVGQGFRLTANSVVKQGYIVGVADTLLTTAGDALTDHTFSAISYTNTPGTAIGFPVWFNWTPTLTGWAASPAVSASIFRYSTVGRICHVIIDIKDELVSHNTTCAISLPITCASGAYFIDTLAWYVDFGGKNTVVGAYMITPGFPAQVSFHPDLSVANNWTASGVKRVIADFFYEI